MKTKMLSDEEKREILKLIKQRRFLKVDELCFAFNGFIENLYKRFIRNKYRFFLEDFVEECYLLILRCARNFRKKTFGQLVTYIKITLSKRAITMSKKHTEFCKNSILGRAEDIYIYENKLSVEGFEENSISLIEIKNYYSQYVGRGISKYEFQVLIESIYGNLKAFAYRRGIKYESIARTLRRVKEKIKKIMKSFNINKAEDYILN